MMKKSLIALAFLVLSTLACSMQDLSNLRAGVNGDYALSPTPSPSSSQNMTAETRPEQRKDDLSSQDEQIGQTYIVCTGNPTGNLRVRVEAGTGAAQASLLVEGTEVSVLETHVLNDGSTWAELAAPAGWANARFLCKGNSQ